jgi:hypothetical protein
LPNIEEHVKFCVRVFGEENRELCYMVNGWMDSPSRELGTDHRLKRHDYIGTPLEACEIYGDGKAQPTPKNILIARMVLQHLRLDGIITPQQEAEWKWEEAIKRSTYSSAIVTERFYDYLLPPKSELESIKEDDCLFRTILIYDGEYRDTEYWIKAINYICSKAAEKYGEENLNARYSKRPFFDFMIRYGRKDKLVNIMFVDGAFSRNELRRSIQTAMSFLQAKRFGYYRPSNKYMLRFVRFGEFPIIYPGLFNVSDGVLITSFNPQDYGIIGKLLGKKGIHSVEKYASIRKENPELKDHVIFIGKEFSGLISLPLLDRKYLYHYFDDREEEHQELKEKESVYGQKEITCPKCGRPTRWVLRHPKGCVYIHWVNGKREWCFVKAADDKAQQTVQSEGTPKQTIISQEPHSRPLRTPILTESLVNVLLMCFMMGFLFGMLMPGVMFAMEMNHVIGILLGGLVGGVILTIIMLVILCWKGIHD